MNVHFSYKTAKSPEVENEIQQHIEKLNKRLQVFRPELVHLHGTVSSGAREGFSVSLNLRLPSGQLSANDNGASALAAVKIAFNDLSNQLRRHKELLRSEHKWNRRQRGDRGSLFAIESAVDGVMASPLPVRRPAQNANGKAEAPADGHGVSEQSFDDRSTSANEIRSYINSNLARLDRFVTRELRYRETNGLLASELSKDEVIDEVVLAALSADEQPANLSTERWLYALAMQTIRRMSADGAYSDSEVNLEQPVGVQNVSGTDDAFLQFHQPEDRLSRADVIADRRVGTPEDLAANDELIDQLESTLKDVTPQQREAFVLMVVEGFSLDEIAAVTDQRVEKVKGHVAAAREHLQKKLPASNTLKEKLLLYSNVA